MTERFRPLRFSRAGIRGLKVSATLSMNERVRAMWARGQPIYHLGFGESRFAIPDKLAEHLPDDIERALCDTVHTMYHCGRAIRKWPTC